MVKVRGSLTQFVSEYQGGFMRLNRFLITLAILLTWFCAFGYAQYERVGPPGIDESSIRTSQKPWYFSAQEIDAAYQFQAHYGQRLANPIHSLPCYMGKTEVVASYLGKEITTPCRFIRQITKQLKDLIDAGSAKYLFALDTDRAHLAVPLELWQSRYSKLPNETVLADLLREPLLIALFQTGAHLRIDDPVTGQVISEAKAWKDKSNAIGYFDGRALAILPPNASLTPADPAGYRTVATVFFQASWLGESLFTVNRRVVSFDLSFDPRLTEPGLFDATSAPSGR